MGQAGIDDCGGGKGARHRSCKADRAVGARWDAAESADEECGPSYGLADLGRDGVGGRFSKRGGAGCESNLIEYVSIQIRADRGDAEVGDDLRGVTSSARL